MLNLKQCATDKRELFETVVVESENILSFQIVGSYTLDKIIINDVEYTLHKKEGED